MDWDSAYSQARVTFCWGEAYSLSYDYGICDRDGEKKLKTEKYRNSTRKVSRDFYS